MDLIIKTDFTHSKKVYQFHEMDLVVGRNKTTRRRIHFVTGNQNKVRELGDQINGQHIELKICDIQFNEIQHSDPLEIADSKCRKAFEKLANDSCGEDKSDHPQDKLGPKMCVLVEDTSLAFTALNGLPGPYIKWFLEAVGAGGLYQMLSGFEDKSAVATCTYALMEDDKQVVFCRGSVKGRITKPRGTGWGWDSVFEEDRTKLTFGEMDAELKGKFSHRSNALIVLRKYLGV